MGFGGGGGGALPNHEHTNIALDGGPLDFVNTTIASLTAGSTTFSDGAALQELVIGNAGDSLVVNGAGTAPEWGGAGGAWVSEGNDINTTPGTSLDVTVSDADVYQILYNVADGGGDYNALVMRINDVDVASTYKALLSQGAALGGSQSDPELTTQDKCLITGEAIERQCNGTIYVYKGDSNFRSGNTGVSYINQGIQNNTSDPYNWQVGGGTFPTLTGAITKISLLFMKTSTTANENIEGSMRVNSLSYS